MYTYSAKSINFVSSKMIDAMQHYCVEPILKNIIALDYDIRDSIKNYSFKALDIGTLTSHSCDITFTSELKAAYLEDEYICHLKFVVDNTISVDIIFDADIVDNTDLILIENTCTLDSLAVNVSENLYKTIADQYRLKDNVSDERLVTIFETILKPIVNAIVGKLDTDKIEEKLDVYIENFKY